MTLHIKLSLFYHIASKNTEWVVGIWGWSERIHSVRAHVDIYISE